MPRSVTILKSPACSYVSIPLPASSLTRMTGSSERLLSLRINCVADRVWLAVP